MGMAHNWDCIVLNFCHMGIKRHNFVLCMDLVNIQGDSCMYIIKKNSKKFFKLADYFASNGIIVFLIDLRGFG